MKKLDRDALTRDLKALSTHCAGSRARGRAVISLADQYGVEVGTIRRWLRAYLAYGEPFPRRRRRTDYGEYRLPETTLRLILSLFRRFPYKSCRQIHVYLRDIFPEAAEYRTGARSGKSISISTITRIKRVYTRRNYIDTVRGEGPRIPPFPSPFSPYDL